MKPTDTQQTKATDLPILSSQSQGWTPILVEQFQSPPGERDAITAISTVFSCPSCPVQ
jgi:hypothetical protein